MLKQRTYQAIRSHVSGSYTTGTLHGKEYIVVPVVALVEGVLQGMAAEGPELALAEEFGKFPDSWNGRPVVMSHPTVEVDGKKTPVSANSPAVLEAYQIGYLFNTVLVGNQLQQEAWINIEVMSSLNDDSKALLDTLQKGEMIEVSTGYYALIEPSDGMHNNEAYQGVQRNVVPDHLAFLPNGTLGACSNADGCGAQLAANNKPTDTFKQIKTFYVQQPCCEECAAKDAVMPEVNKTPKDTMVEDKKKKKQDPKSYQQVQTTFANTIAGGVTLEDVRTLVCEALRATQLYSYVLAMTKDKVIYEQYNSFDGRYDKYQQGYSVSAEGKVTLSGDVEKVQLLTKVVTVNADGSASETTEQDMPEADKTGAVAPVVENTEKTHTIENESGSLEVTLNADGTPKTFKLTPKVQAAKTPSTTEEFIAQAPKQIQEVLNSAIALHNHQKTSLIANLKETKRCKFSDEALQAMSLPELENLAELANVPSYGGRAAPIVTDNNSDDAPPTAPMVFEVVQGGKTAAA